LTTSSICSVQLTVVPRGTNRRMQSIEEDLMSDLQRRRMHQTLLVLKIGANVLFIHHSSRVGSDLPQRVRGGSRLAHCCDSQRMTSDLLIPSTTERRPATSLPPSPTPSSRDCSATSLLFHRRAPLRSLP
jgi:hypothetical protein